MESIILYSNDCPKCRVIESKLKAQNVEFEKTDNFEKLISLGYKTLPLLEVDGEIMDFKSANDWVEERRAIVNEH